MADGVGSYVTRYIASLVRWPNELFRGMARHPELCCLVLAFIITLLIKYGSSSIKGKPMTVPAKPPQFMFSPATFVLDSPRGSLLPVIQALNQQEFVFVMYYAPWCSKSQAARAEFIKAANFFHGQVMFAAVNCWWPEGDCRKRYKFLMFPVFLAYHTKLDGYRYFGVPRAEWMVKFVENLLTPVTLVSSREETWELIAKHDTVVLGYFNFSSKDNVGPYRQYYYASMRIFEKDPTQPAKFSVVTRSDVAAQFNLTQFTDIVMLRLTNSSLTYPFVNNITSSNLIQWVVENKDLKTVKRLSPEGLKSQALAAELNTGPAFILFHAENPLFEVELGFRVLKNVALLYRECLIESAYSGIRGVWSKGVRHQIQRYQQQSDICARANFSETRVQSDASCCISVLIYDETGYSRVCHICHDQSHPCDLLPAQLSWVLNQSRPLLLNCRCVVLNYSWSGRLSVCCHLRSFLKKNISWYKASATDTRNGSNSVFPYKTDLHSQIRRLSDRYVRHHLENLPRRMCDRFTAEKQHHLKSVWSQDLHSETVKSDWEKHFSHVGCSSNKSLHFYTIDSQSHWMFSDALGLKANLTRSQPVAVLFDNMNEEHYIMKESFTLSNTMSFILDFELGKLQRHQQSHSFDYHIKGSDDVHLRELSSDTFMEAVMEEDQDVVLLVYAHWCGFCQTVSHTFLSLARHFSSCESLHFVRINGATNDLPWEYTFSSYPTVLFFPAKRKADSVLFPETRELTLINLVRFVLQHISLPNRLHLAAEVCGPECIRQNLQRSTAMLQRLKLKHSQLLLNLGDGSDLTQASGSNHNQHSAGVSFDQLNTDFLISRFKEINSKIQRVATLIEYLERHQDLGISKQELVSLLLSDIRTQVV